MDNIIIWIRSIKQNHQNCQEQRNTSKQPMPFQANLPAEDAIKRQQKKQFDYLTIMIRESTFPLSGTTFSAFSSSPSLWILILSRKWSIQIILMIMGGRTMSALSIISSRRGKGSRKDCLSSLTMKLPKIKRNLKMKNQRKNRKKK